MELEKYIESVLRRLLKKTIASLLREIGIATILTEDVLHKEHGLHFFFFFKYLLNIYIK
jgi:hypothetical protein